MRREAMTIEKIEAAITARGLTFRRCEKSTTTNAAWAIKGTNRGINVVWLDWDEAKPSRFTVSVTRSLARVRSLGSFARIERALDEAIVKPMPGEAASSERRP